MKFILMKVERRTENSPAWSIVMKLSPLRGTFVLSWTRWIVSCSWVASSVELESEEERSSFAEDKEDEDEEDGRDGGREMSWEWTKEETKKAMSSGRNGVRSKRVLEREMEPQAFPLKLSAEKIVWFSLVFTEKSPVVYTDSAGL